MIYVFDTSSILELQAYYPATFPASGKGWTVWSLAVKWYPLRKYERRSTPKLQRHIFLDWVDLWPRLFTVPTPDEQAYVAEIFAIPHFRQLVGSKQLERGMPVADPFIVA